MADDAYLVTVEYEDDAERKRAEYLLDNWEEGSVKSVTGLSRIARCVDIHDLYDSLVAKIPESRISTYELTSVSSDVTTSGERLSLRTAAQPDRVEWAMESVLNKRKAVQEPGAENSFAVYTKKGRANVEYEVHGRGEDVVLEIEIEGFGEAATFLRDYFEDELEYMV